MISYPYKDETRDIRSNITLCLKGEQETGAEAGGEEVADRGGRVPGHPQGAPVIILVTRESGFGAGGRSHMLRAVAQLVVVCDIDQAEEEEIKKLFDVTHVN